MSPHSPLNLSPIRAAFEIEAETKEPEDQTTKENGVDRREIKNG
jgi:hypothetical protein